MTWTPRMPNHRPWVHRRESPRRDDSTQTQLRGRLTLCSSRHHGAVMMPAQGRSGYSYLRIKSVATMAGNRSFELCRGLNLTASGHNPFKGFGLRCAPTNDGLVLRSGLCSAVFALHVAGLLSVRARHASGHSYAVASLRYFAGFSASHRLSVQLNFWVPLLCRSSRISSAANSFSTSLPRMSALVTY